jgi:hypothetical protein
MIMFEDGLKDEEADDISVREIKLRDLTEVVAEEPR